MIAHEYLRKLEQRKDAPAIERFKETKVVAKVVVGTTSNELKEITNSNNRQNPIDNWQLFSNESIHIEIEAALKEVGVFYERQKGKFDSLMKRTDVAQHYFATNRTFIKVVDLAQVIALARQDLQWAAKPSDIFINKENHDKIFDATIPGWPRDIIFATNLFKAAKRGLTKYLEIPAHVNSTAPFIFKKQIIRAHAYFLVLLHFYQNPKHRASLIDFSTSLNKIASAKLVEEVCSLYSKVVHRTKAWYTQESKDLTEGVSKKKLDAFFGGLAIELGIDVGEGARPFSAAGIDARGLAGFARPS